MKGLIIDEPWIGLILRGTKTWEMRKGVCHHRGRVGLIRKGSGQVVGTAEVVDCRQQIHTLQEYAVAEPLHCIPPARQQRAFDDGWTTPWVLANARQLASPVNYAHPYGAVIWVNLAEHVIAQVVGQGEDRPEPHEMTMQKRPELRSPNPTTEVPPPTRPDNRHVPGEPFREIQVTGGNLRNNHFYLPLDFFPEDVLGGSNKAAAARGQITVRFVPGPTVTTDIDSTKRILRERAAVGVFFERAKVGEGDTLLLSRVSPYEYSIEKKLD